MSSSPKEDETLIQKAYREGYILGFEYALSRMKMFNENHYSLLKEWEKEKTAKTFPLFLYQNEE